tara:strand:+ start:771 stop:998 length:228 start_codon:yes stop_codon:yes gene_type:complete
MEKLKITCSTDTTKFLLIDKTQALKLELAINTLPNPDYWRKLGDQLYNYHAYQKINAPVIATPPQLDTFKNILNL